MPLDQFVVMTLNLRRLDTVDGGLGADQFGGLAGRGLRDWRLGQSLVGGCVFSSGIGLTREAIAEVASGAPVPEAAEVGPKIELVTQPLTAEASIAMARDGNREARFVDRAEGRIVELAHDLRLLVARLLAAAFCSARWAR